MCPTLGRDLHKDHTLNTTPTADHRSDVAQPRLPEDYVREDAGTCQVFGKFGKARPRPQQQGGNTPISQTSPATNKIFQLQMASNCKWLTCSKRGMHTRGREERLI